MSEENNLNSNNNNNLNLNEKNKNPKSGLRKSVLAAVLIGAVCLWGGYTFGKDAGRLLPATYKNYDSGKVYATVGDTKITGDKLQKEMNTIFYGSGVKKLSEEDIKAAENQLLDSLKMVDMFYQEGKSKKVEVSKDDIKSQYTSYMNNIKQKLGMDEKKYLKTFNFTKSEIEETLKKQMIANKYYEQSMKLSDDELKTYYDENKDKFQQVKASHILIKNKDDNNKAVSEDQKKKNKEKIDEILKKAKAGEDFASLAKEHSQDTSAQDGGNLDFFTKDKMVKPFSDAAFSLKVGEISDVVESDFGYHIILKTDEKTETFEEAKEAGLEQQFGQEKQQKLIDSLMKKYKVEDDSKKK